MELNGDDALKEYQYQLNRGLKIAFERCPSCNTTHLPFTCQNCIQEGNYFRSNSDDCETFREKLERYQRYKAGEHNRIYQKLCTELDKKLKIEAKKWEVKQLRQQIEFMKKSIEEIKTKKTKDEESLNAVSEQVKQFESRAKSHRHKLDKIKKYIEQIKENLSDKRHKLDEREEELCETRKIRVNQLVLHIFPISEIRSLKSDEDEEGKEDLIAALADARQTSFVRGRWVFSENQSEVQYLIVDEDVLLPGNGDYSAYTAWIETNEPLLRGPGTEVELRNPAFQLSAALCFTAHLVCLVSFYLGVNLPRKLCFSEFCGKEMSPSRFSKSVANLNANIMYLCSSQKIAPEKILSYGTLRNMLTLLEPTSGYLGRCGPFDVTVSLTEARLLSPEVVLSDSESSDTGAIDYESELQTEDWEDVPKSSIVTIPFPNSQSAMNLGQQDVTQRRSSMNVTASVHTAGGLVSSAAASMASLWRAATGTTSSSPPDKS
ncbi:beclin 1-associated autophagy-related key regulator-like isoform X2 [Anneissia japonica]|uniref:beclin 1-associated autophagy-related key regulator-like isoform X2 n=1 Tax=Anneissia japonica TaxID=1529436 RepID=UPI00142598E8|nr:beclin 1-associated autophagy-related key regulator-like isoform X2 [Anneissia japonica]